MGLKDKGGRDQREKSKSRRHNPLGSDIENHRLAKKKGQYSTAMSNTTQDEGYVHDKLSKKIIKQAQLQQREIETEEQGNGRHMTIAVYIYTVCPFSLNRAQY